MGCSISSSLLPKKQLKYLTKRQPYDAVSLCKARKHLVKKAVKKRQAFADAHSNYLHSLSSISTSIALFISHYSSFSVTPSEFFVTFAPSDDNNDNNKVIEDGVKVEERECGGVFDGFVDDFGVNSVEFGGDEFINNNNKWDFFDFVKEEGGISKGELKEVVCKEEKQEKKGKGNEKGKGKGNERELLEALKDVEDHFMRAVESGREVSRMLEVHRIPCYPSFEEIKDNAFRKQSILSRSSSFKSLFSNSSKSTSATGAESGGDRKSSLSCTSSDTSSTLAETKSDPLDSGHWGMISGSHSFTLGRLYAWEKKLYHEVKAMQQTRKLYKQKCSQLQQKDSEGNDLSPSKASSEVTDLYHLMVVALQHAESISKQIEKIRDEELQPQLFELLYGLMRNWNSMSETHEIQCKIMKEINAFSCQEHEKFSNDSQRQATHQLQGVIQAWNFCFVDYVSAQKAYVKALQGWLSKFIDAEAQYHYNSSFSFPPAKFNGPTLMVTCQRWFMYLDRLPDISVKYAIKSLSKDIQALWIKQGAEQQQKRKVDGLSKEMERKMLTFGKAEDKALVVKHPVHGYADEQADYLSEKKRQLEIFRQRVEIERERYQSSVQETELVAMKRLQMGFSSAFESLADFSRASAKAYGELVTLSQNGKV